MRPRRDARLEIRIPKDLKDDFTLLVENDTKSHFSGVSDAVTRLIKLYVQQNGKQLSLLKADELKKEQ